ncbi:MAG: S8 family peptidase [Bacillota bacterium]
MLEQFQIQEKNILEKAKEYKFSPFLITKVELEDDVSISEDLREKLDAIGLKIINQENKNIIVLFAGEAEKVDFYAALNKYTSGEIALTKVVHDDLFKIFKNVDGWNSTDRIGAGLDRIKDVDFVDCYLWVFDSVSDTRMKAQLFKEDVKKLGASISDDYISSGLAVIRVKVNKKQLDGLLEHPLVYKVDAVQKYLIAHKFAVSMKNLAIDDVSFDNSKIDAETSSSICVIDSGIFRGHPLLKNIVGDTKVFYSTEGYSDSDSDIDGHGTMVASMCAYGDFEPTDTFKPSVFLYSAKIHDGEYIGNCDLCLKELKEEGFNLTFEHEDVIDRFYRDEIDIDDVVKRIGLKNRINEFKSILKKYINIYDRLIPNQMREIVDYFYRNYKCNIFNLSQGDPAFPYLDGKPRAWACVLDELQQEYDVLFVVSAGNSKYEIFYDGDIKDISAEYPKYFLKYNDCRIIDPANSVTSITVGALSTCDIPSSHEERLIQSIPISEANQISTISRIGPGVRGAKKPDFVAYGGDRCIDIVSSRFKNNPSLCKILFSNNLKDGLFCFDCGTSYAAPVIAHVAAKIKNKYPDLSCNMLRALIACSSQIPPEIIKMLEEKVFSVSGLVNEVPAEFTRNDRGTIKLDKNKIKYWMAGYGMPVLDNCTDTFENRVVMYADNKESHTEIAPDVTHIYEIPIPQEFRHSKGTKRIIVSLAFNPEVRKSRLDYMGHEMSFRLIRGKSFDDVYQVYASQKGKKEALDLFPKVHVCDVTEPGSEFREKGTLQKGIFEFSNKSDEYGDFYYLVVNCERKWSNVNQKYAVAVALEASDSSVKLENVVREMIRTRRRVRA